MNAPHTQSNTATTRRFDVVIVGSGLAGLSTALLLPSHLQVAILTKRTIADGSSGWAQGGIAAVLAEDDSFEAHVQDTFVAGAGLCDPAATRFTIEHAPESIAWLRAMGTEFTQHDGELHLTREGGHSHRRIVHAADATGAVTTSIQSVTRATRETSEAAGQMETAAEELSGLSERLRGEVGKFLEEIRRK